MTPLVAITTYGREDQRFALPTWYVDAVRRAGAVPILVPPGDPNLGALLDRVDGLILGGGGDICPDIAGCNPHSLNYKLDAERDRTEIELAHEAIARGLPTLGICRGCQVINVALGGTLIEHVPDVVGERVLHRQSQGQTARHSVRIEPKSRLAGVIGQTECEVVSWHHQAIRLPAEPLRVTAHADDGTIEAVELPEHPWFIAVQWHAEMSPADDVPQQRLFAGLADAARRHGSCGGYDRH
jgi:putative glutamine amidotransferase